LIYYLTKDWKAEFGGTLVDIPTDDKYVPEFNSLIAFTIPRFHEVLAVTCDRPRYSIFGWFLTEGKLYDLNTSMEEGKKEKKVENKESGENEEKQSSKEHES
jgi:Rps23 Pro-64 3,4-dihydroxylase Tpa1-like proline 4-hydroxylase